MSSALRLIFAAILGVGIGFALVQFRDAVSQSFRVPDAGERRRAMGDLSKLKKRERLAFWPADRWQPIDTPGPNDWLAQRTELGQTFDRYVESQPNRPGGEHKKIYLLPLGRFDEERSPSLKSLQQYAEAFFAVPVEVLPKKPLRGLRLTSRQHPTTRKRQLLTRDVLRELKTLLPEDAFCLLGITMVDIYPGDDWNFVFGQASLRGRVGVYSFARYDPLFYGEPASDDDRTTILSRSCKVLAHETAHMFGLMHCIYFQCAINGSNGLFESDGRPMHLCPVCLRKLNWNIGFDLADRYRHLWRFYRDHKLDAEADWTRRSYRVLKPRKSKPSGKAGALEKEQSPGTGSLKRQKKSSERPEEPVPAKTGAGGGS